MPSGTKEVIESDEEAAGELVIGFMAIPRPPPSPNTVVLLRADFLSILWLEV